MAGAPYVPLFLPTVRRRSENAGILDVDTQSFLIVLAAAAIAPVIAAVVGTRVKNVILPVVVVELLLGVVIGPSGFHLAEIDDVIGFFAQLGLGFLFFFAGYEIRFNRIKGSPLVLAACGWIVSLVLAYSIAYGLEASNIVISGLLTGSAMATTAVGTLIPILRDEKQLDTHLGTYILGAGAIGELGPILIVTLVLGTQSDSATNQLILLGAFVLLAVVAAVISTGIVSRSFDFIDERMDETGQLPVRLTVLLLFALVILASDLGLDVILGAFAAGMIMNLILGDREMPVFESKLDAVGFGFLIPFFFITSGMNIEISSLTESIGAFLKLPLFLLLFLVVRGAPVFMFYRDVLPKPERWPMALMSATELPLVVAITSIGLAEHEMRPSTAAALVGAGVLSVLIFPSISIVLLRRSGEVVNDPVAPPAT
jgi:Kef-type K+ transport system membrane component KefB